MSLAILKCEVHCEMSWGIVSVLCCAVLCCAVVRCAALRCGERACGIWWTYSSRVFVEKHVGGGVFLCSLRESSVRVLLGGRDYVYSSLLGSCRLVSRDAALALVLGFRFRLLLWRPCAHGNGGRTAAAAAATLSRARGGCGCGCGAYVTDGFHKTAPTVHLPVLSILVNPYLRVAAASPRLALPLYLRTLERNIAPCRRRYRVSCSRARLHVCLAGANAVQMLPT